MQATGSNMNPTTSTVARIDLGILCDPLVYTGTVDGLAIRTDTESENVGRCGVGTESAIGDGNASARVEEDDTACGVSSDDGTIGESGDAPDDGRLGTILLHCELGGDVACGSVPDNGCGESETTNEEGFVPLIVVVVVIAVIAVIRVGA
jgi:hypothetical protein